MGDLYIVPTPIGNLGDISDRIKTTLGSVTRIFAEDTRRTGKLLKSLDLKVPLNSYHEHNVEKAIPLVLQSLSEGDVALVSDSGTPLISDPGFKLVRALTEAEVNVISIPGPSAFLTALVASGLPTDKFSFRGFLPRKASKIKKELESILDRDETVIYYESPYRIIKTVGILADIVDSERQIVVARELTKLHEEYIRGNTSEVLEKLASKGNPKGEFILLISKK